jgi:hypothetical protein
VSSAEDADGSSRPRALSLPASSECAARFTCLCSEPEIDGGATKRVAAQPAFCESPAPELASAFAAARRACGW